MDFQLPEIGEGVYEAELVRWLVQPGDSVRVGTSIAEVLTDKATSEVPSPFTGTVMAVLHDPGTRIRVGDVILNYQTTVRTETPPASSLPAPAAANGHAPANGHVPRPATAPTPAPAAKPLVPIPVAAPSVRHLARKLNIDLTKIKGTGPGGRILLEDLTEAIPAVANRKTMSADVAPDFGTPGTRIRMVGLRRRIAEKMVEAARVVPSVSYIDECDVTELVRLRAALREPCAERGLKLTYLPFFIRATILALKSVPLINSSVDPVSGDIVLHDRYHIGIATAAPQGLLVPVIRDADSLDIWQLAREVERLSSEARAGKSRPADLSGSTFTITSIGSIGGLISTPMINYPEAAIMGIGKMVRRPVYDEAGAVKPAEMVYLSFTFDHRPIDGAIGATFANLIIRHLKNPAALMLPANFG